MEDLKKLVEIISLKRQRQYPLLEFKNINENPSKENVFYRHIKSGKINSDDDASNLIYNTKSNDDRYRMLKSRLKQKLLNHMFFLDFTDKKQTASIYFEQECIQQLHQARVLLFTGENKIAKSLILKALTTANRCELTKYKIACFENLIKIYSDSCQPHLFDDIINNLNETRDLYRREVESRELYYFIKMMVVKSVNSRKKNLEKVKNVISTLEKLYKKTKSFNIFEYLIKLTLLHKELTGDFEEIISILQEIEESKFHNEKLNELRIDYFNIMQSLAFAYFKSWKFSEGMAYIENRINLFDKSSSDWYDFSEIYFLISIYSKNYRTSLSIIDDVFSNKTFEKLSIDQRNKWNLFNAYLHMIYTGKIYMKSFDNLKVAKQTPEYEKNKEGFNFAVIILQFMYFLGQGRLDELAKRRNVLKGYMANHFKENFSYRSRTLYKLINIVVENNMNYKLIIQKSRYLVKKLNENQIVSSAHAEFEIVPYEHLWDNIINSIMHLENRTL